jgi:adenosine deaminase
MVRVLTNDRVTANDYVIDKPVSSFDAYFAPWAVSRFLARSAEKTRHLVRSVAFAFAEDAVTYAELRNSVRHLADLNEISWSMAISWLLEALDDASQVSNVDLRLIVSLTREHFTLERAFAMLDAMRDHVGHPRLVGIDLTGDERLTVPRKSSRIFRQVKEELGLGVTIHAGEIYGTADNVLWAIRDCSADRVGHGLAAATDARCLDTLLEAGTCVEVCLTSNLLTSSVRTLADHPVPLFVQTGIPIVLCSDNPGVHARSLSDEYHLLESLIPDTTILRQTRDAAFKYAFRRQ